MGLEVLQSILREMFRQLPSYVATSGQPEEKVEYTKQRKVARSWNVDTIETFSLPENKKTDKKHIWNLELPCLYYDDYSNYSIKFPFFIDGIQRTSRIREILWQRKGSNTVPLLVAQLGCIVLERTDRSLYVNKVFSKFDTLLEVPIEFLRGNARENVKICFDEIHNRRHPSFKWVDTTFATKQVEETESGAEYIEDIGFYKKIPDREFRENLLDPNWLRHHSQKWTTKYRDNLEQEVYDSLAREFGLAKKSEKHYEFIVKDGTLTSKRGEFLKSAIGLSKSFNTRFLDPKLQDKVINLFPYHRTPVFIFKRGYNETEVDLLEEDQPSTEPHTVATWYVRIRPTEMGLPYWGLLRIELNPSVLPSKGSADRWNKEDSIFISAISSAIINEANPTSHPDPRWHNLIYPIKMCEKYGKSKLIPHETVNCLFNWGGALNE